MKSVISASRRTDIPAFYLKWFMDAIKTGQIEVTNPLYRKNTRTVKLDPDHVNWIVFWSRNYAHFLRHKDIFKYYNLFFHFTILPKSVLEKSGILLDKALDQIKQLAETYGPDRIIWRYDPIVHWIENKTILSNHNPENFENLCRNISNFGIQRCYFSFVQPYQKYERRFAKTFPDWEICNLQLKEQIKILDRMVEISSKYNIILYSCCNDTLLEREEIQKGHCIDGSLLNRLDSSMRVSEAKTPTRPDCGCTRSTDIGDYIKQPCHYGCIYCYANPSGY
ncbi:MAG: DUF1848 family protein [Calditrichaceae bacterium]